jgi:hypothetical protein
VSQQGVVALAYPPPTHVVPEQVSLIVQGLPSSQAVATMGAGPETHVVLEHVSFVVQGLPSSHDVAPEAVPGTQVPALHWSFAVHAFRSHSMVALTTVAPATQVPELLQ